MNRLSIVDVSLCKKCLSIHSDLEVIQYCFAIDPSFIAHFVEKKNIEYCGCCEMFGLQYFAIGSQENVVINAGTRMLLQRDAVFKKNLTIEKHADLYINNLTIHGDLISKGYISGQGELIVMGKVEVIEDHVDEYIKIIKKKYMEEIKNGSRSS